MKTRILALAVVAAAFQAAEAYATVPASEEAFDIRYASTAKTVSTKLELPIDGTLSYVVGNYNFSMRTLGDTPATTSFVGYCVDPFQWANSSFHTYTASPLSGSLEISRYSLVAKLFGHAYESSLGDATQAAGFQLALWEVFNDDGVLNQGDVRVVAATKAEVKQAAQNLLTSLSTWTDVGKHYQLTFYEHAQFQDYVAVTGMLSPTPEPETYAMLLGGLALLGVFTRRRRMH